MLASKFCSYSCHVTPSTPTAAVFFRLKKASVKQSSSTWCNKAVNLSVLSLRAASRTPCSPRDLRWFRLCVRRKAFCSAFLLAESLSSADSADASAASLFAGFAGTTDPSDFLLAFMSALPSVTFADRSVVCRIVGAETNRISRFSRLEFPRHAQVLRLRRVAPAARHSAHDACCLPHVSTRSARETVISELNSWPACTPCQCYTHSVTAIGVWLGAERLARSFSYDSFIRYSKPVYPGAFTIRTLIHHFECPQSPLFLVENRTTLAGGVCSESGVIR